MITKHTFVSLLDAGEILPFVPKESAGLEETLKDHKRLKDEIERFVKILQRRFGEKIYHLGSEIIEGKSFQEFMFQGSGFLEISWQAPIAINAHFHDKQRARHFATALKSAIRQIVQPSMELEIFLSSIDVKDEHETSIQFQNWAAMSNVRGMLHKSVSLALISTFVFAMFEAGEEIAGEAIGGIFGFQHGGSQIYVFIVVAVTIAFFFKRVEHKIDHVVSKFIFRKL